MTRISARMRADLVDAARLAAEQVLVGHLDVLEEDLARHRGAHRHLVDRLAERDARASCARSSRKSAMFFMPALVRRLGGHRQHVGHRRAGHPRLGPAQHPAVAAALGARRDAGDVGAGVGLGQREGRDEVAAQRRREVARAAAPPSRTCRRSTCPSATAWPPPPPPTASRAPAPRRTGSTSPCRRRRRRTPRGSAARASPSSPMRLKSSRGNSRALVDGLGLRARPRRRRTARPRGGTLPARR